MIELTPFLTSHLDIAASYSDVPQLFDMKGESGYRYVGQEQSARFGIGLDVERVGSDGFSACVALVIKATQHLELAHLQPESDMLQQLDLSDIKEALMIQGSHKDYSLASQVKSRLFEANCTLFHVMTIPNDSRPFAIAVDAPAKTLSVLTRQDEPVINRYRIST